jgi:hypothetical protein
MVRISILPAYAGFCRMGIKKPAYAGMGLAGENVNFVEGYNFSNQTIRP